jgi:glycosyltransferase involved in cell wall biosynthesis
VVVRAGGARWAFEQPIEVKLLLFSTHFPNGALPIRGVFNLQQARSLARRCEVRVVAPMQWFPVQLGHGAGPELAPLRETWEGLETWHPRYVLTPGVARATFPLQMAAAVLPFVAKLRKDYPFDVILATWAFPDVVVGAALSRIWRVPLLAKVHGSDINVQAGFPARAGQIRWALRRAHRVLAVSGALRERLIELGVPDERIMVHHNGVDRERFRPRDRPAARRELGIGPEGRQVAFVGHFQEAKALPVLLEALAQLQAQGGLDFVTHLVGGGPLEAELRGRVSSLELTQAVRFHGHRPHAEIPGWMAAADVLCLPSIREGCPNVLLEAWASGTPAVSTSVGGIPEIAREENSMLVPPGDAPALAAALRAALDREWDRRVVRETTARFSWETSAEALYDAARQALAPRAAAHPEAALSPSD